VQLGIHFPNFTFPEGSEVIAPNLAESAKVADEAGVELFTVMDHWFQMEQLATAQDPMLEAYTALGFVAGQTSRIKLGTLVTGVTYRRPALLAKTVTTLDVLSGGRAMLGIGAAWYEREHQGLGVPYPAVAERFELLEETIQVCLQMWSDDDGPFEGRHVQLAETIGEPKPLQRPRPPILIGGSGEKKTLKLVARYADACNLFGDPDEVAHKLDVLARHCEDEGRDPAEIQKTVLVMGPDPAADPDGYLVLAEQYAAIGVQLMGSMPMGPKPVEWVTDVAEKVLPRLSEIEPKTA
jgi:F420-dependent oxidoreductase-like protein